MKYRWVLVAVIAVALLAALAVAYKRHVYEAESRRVEIVMDATDFLSLARAYNYNPATFLIELRRAGLTSFAVQEELGSTVGANGDALAITGPNLLEQARLAPIADPSLAALVATHRVSPNEVYLSVYDKPTYLRYLWSLPIHLGRSSITVLRNRLPYLIAVRTDPDYFTSLALGLPSDQVELSRRLHLLLVPRIQNDERVKPWGIAAIFAQVARDRPVSTVIFFGLRNQVLGFPDDVDATADAFKASKLNFGAIEVYDETLAQKGTDELAKGIPGQTTRVQAIAKAEQDKLDPQTLIQRYLLGVRERNIRVIYLRPFLHEWDGRSLFKTNVELVRQLRAGLLAEGFKLGRATPVPPWHVPAIVLIVISLAVPAVFLLLLDLYGFGGVPIAAAVFVLDLLVMGGGIAVHHDMLARKLVALAGALLFPVAAAFAIAPAFRERAEGGLGSAVVAGLRTLAIAVGVTLGGALVVIGLLSTPLTMEEIDRFTGVKAVLVVPPLLVLIAYLTNARFGTVPGEARGAFASPVRLYQLLLGIVLIVAAVLIVSRSGNQSDIAPSNLELALRAHLTTLLSVRPRFKEFVLGFPLLMLLPTLVRSDVKMFGWLVALGIGVGLGDVVDTFSHLHTALDVSLLRLANGLVIGAILGVIAIAVYRAVRRRRVPVVPPGPAAARTPVAAG